MIAIKAMAYNITSSINTNDTGIQCTKSILVLSQRIKCAHIYIMLLRHYTTKGDVSPILG
jgi:hypothetical protein